MFIHVLSNILSSLEPFSPPTSRLPRSLVKAIARFEHCRSTIKHFHGTGLHYTSIATPAAS
eukprot:COSAG01_NODE_421_length_17271_cov_524.391218_8_plen_61_part_00